jgi:hypothetical protein
MNASEEIVTFQYELGRAIAHWGYVEFHVLQTALMCVSVPDRQALAIGYLSVENFRSKVALCDNLVRHRFGKSQHLEKWLTARELIDECAGKRNKIAHGWQKLYVHNVSGRRWAICPIQHNNGQLLNLDGKKPPTGAVCLRDLVRIRLEFHALTARLVNVRELLCRNRTLFPESDEQPKGPPTIQHINAQIRAEFGLPYLSSREKRRLEDAKNAASSLRS